MIATDEAFDRIPVPAASKELTLRGVTGYEGDSTWQDEWAGHVGNWAGRMRPGFVGLDIDGADHGSGKRGPESISALEADLGALPEGPYITRHGESSPNRIRIFRIPEGVRLSERSLRDVEIIQRHHRYIMLPGSVFDDKEYAVYGPATVPDLPAGWVESLRADTRHAVSLRPPAEVEGFLAAHTRKSGPRTRYALELIDPETAGNSTLMGDAAFVFRRAFGGYNWDGDGGAESLQELHDILEPGYTAKYDTEKFETDWDAVVTKLVSELIAERESWERFSLTEFESLSHEVPTGAPKRKTGRKAGADLMAREFAPLQWVVPGLIPEGTTMLVAPPKIGKSWLALDVAIAAGRGGKAFGSIETGAARPVLYIDLESGERRLQARIQAQGWDSLGRFEYFLEKEGALDEFDAFMAEHKGQRPFVVIDTLAGVMTERTKEQTQYKADYDMLSRFQKATKDDPGAAVLIVHHSRKQADSDPMALVSGTNGVAGAVDTPIVLSKPDRHKPEGELNVMARDFEGGEFALTFEGARWVLAAGGLDDSQAAHKAREIARKRANLGPIKQAALEILERNMEKAWTIAEVAERCAQYELDTVRKALAAMALDGLVEKPERGTYRGLSH